MISRLITALGLAALVALSVLRVTRPPAPVPASAPDTLFSAERARSHIVHIAERPHPMGSADHDRVRDYILAQLAALGVRTEVQTATAVGTRYPQSGRVQNVIGYLRGRTPGGKAVLLMAHYDGVEAGPAAADDGAGVAAMLETMRALRARKQPLEHDVIALFTDGEEAGLLGAAAFVREHPRAQDVAFVINLEARGTAGRSFMFETGPGNLDAVRLLRRAGDVTAGSVFTTIYRTLPNDTDLSELERLQVPALNFAFTRGVERYHTTSDDTTHLSLGSVQHHGQQMLAVAATAASGELPRPRTGDAVFFDLPLIGLVVYPIWVAYALGIGVLVLFVLVWWPMRSAAAVIAAVIAFLCVAACGAAAGFLRLSGPLEWSGWSGAALAFAVLGVNAAAYAAVDARWKTARAGGLLLWAMIAVATSALAPTVSYLFAWPSLFALVAARSRHPAVEWISGAFALLLLAGFAVAAAVIMLGVAGAGALALAAFTSLLVWLVGPLVKVVLRTWRSAVAIPLVLAAASAAVAKVVAVPSAEHPLRSSLVYAENVDEVGGFFGTTAIHDSWTRSGLGDATPGLPWTYDLGLVRAVLYGRDVVPAGLPRPDVAITRDTTTATARELTLHLDAPRGTTAVVVRVRGASVLRSSIDGVPVDTTRFRRRQRDWVTEYWNVPPEGATIALTMPADARGTLEIAARRPGLPALLHVPPRPAWVAASQAGDVSIVYHAVRF
jgi:hypothetical protein